MELLDLLTKWDELNVNQLLQFLEDKKEEVNLLFFNLQPTDENTNTASKILSRRVNRLTQEDKDKEVIQGLVYNLATYFIKVYQNGKLQACVNLLNDEHLKRRFEATVSYLSYNKWQHFIRDFEQYISKITLAISDEYNDISNELLTDIKKYQEYGVNIVDKLSGDNEQVEIFKSLFTKDEYLDKYELLRAFRDKKNLVPNIKISEFAGKIYEPSESAVKLFNDKFIDYIKNHSETDWHQTLLGYNTNTIRNDIIKFGRTNFDNDYNDNLKAKDKVKLYCYFNMRKHYYTSYALFESIYDSIVENEVINFVDVGCGPATSGIALVHLLYNTNNAPVTFNYYACDISKAMLDEAKNIMTNSAISKDSNLIFTDDFDKIIDTDFLGNKIYINTCYLFASSSLDVDNLVLKINEIVENNSDKRVYLLFQNPQREDRNSKYHQFKSLLKFKEKLSSHNKILYNNKRSSSYPPASEDVYFEILELI